MPKPKPSRPFLASARGILALAAAAAVLFLCGELILLGQSDSGQISLAKHFKLVEHSRVTQIFSSAMKRALRAQGVDPDQIQESFPRGGPAPLRWDLDLGPGGSLTLTNYTLSQAVRSRGGRVMSGQEARQADGGVALTLVVGLPDYATHEVVVRRPEAPPPEEKSAALALVLFGFAADDTGAVATLDVPVPAAVALIPGTPLAGRLLKQARARQREVLLSLPLEPLNYPRVDPGPGAVLVTMKPLEVRRLMRKHLDLLGPVAGVSNHMGSLATQDIRAMRQVYDELRRERLPFVHVDPVAGEICRQLSSDMGVAYQTATIVLDREARDGDVKALDRGWKKVVAYARGRGRAVVFLRATPAVRRWLPRVADPKRHEGVDLVPFSQLVPKPPPA